MSRTFAKTSGSFVEEWRAYGIALLCILCAAPSSIRKMIERGKSPREVFQELSSSKSPKTESLAYAYSERGYSDGQAMEKRDPDSIIKDYANNGISVITPFDTEYPELLYHCRDRPFLLFKKGESKIGFSDSVSIVGTRKPSAYGKRNAEKLSCALSQNGICVISGGAYGIDTACHRAVVECGGATVAILGCGVNFAYPAENEMLFDSIAKNGCLLSEYPPQRKPERYHFPERNRLIACISKVTVVVEAGKKSGALITASIAAEEGREVYCFPGDTDREISYGCNMLISQGAGLICSVKDFMKDISLAPLNIGERFCDNQKHEAAIPKTSTGTEKAILETLRSSPMSAEELCEATGGSAHNIFATIMRLLVSGEVAEEEGGVYRLSS